eukprot:Tamp_33313.p2 GENE.Tamp_33313~~Tamp_33313.p2  ORF type:complete len:149 (+),score=13.15 Tamp_33313:42-449(+)
MRSAWAAGWPPQQTEADAGPRDRPVVVEATGAGSMAGGLDSEEREQLRSKSQADGGGSSENIPSAWLNDSDARTPCKPTLSAHILQSPTNVSPCTPILSGARQGTSLCVCAVFMHRARLALRTTRTGRTRARKPA